MSSKSHLSPNPNPKYVEMTERTHILEIYVRGAHEHPIIQESE